MNRDEYINKLIFLEINTQSEELKRLLLIYNEETVSHPYDPKNWLFYGFLLFKIKKYEAASDALNKALELDSKVLETWLKEKNLFSKAKFIKEINEKYSEEIKKAKSIIETKSRKKRKLAEKIVKSMHFDPKLTMFLTDYDSFFESLISLCTNTGIPFQKLKYGNEIYENGVKEYENLKLEIRIAENSLNEISEKMQKILMSTQKIIFEINSTNIYNLDDYKAWVRRGNILNKYGELETAQEAFDKASEIRDKKFLMWYKKGEEAFKEKHYTQALSDINESISIKENDFKALSLKGIVLYKLEMYKESLDTFDKILELNPDDAQAWSLKGEILNKIDQKKDAIAAYDKALNVGPVNANVLFKKGNVLYELGLFEDALDAYNKSLEIKPENYKIWSNKGNALFRLNRYEEGLQAFQRSLDIKPEANILFKKAECLKKLSCYDEALKAYDEAAEFWLKISEYYSKKIVPMNEMNAYENLTKALLEKGYILSKLDRLESANIEFNRAVEIYFIEASFYYNHKNFKKVIECCDEALALNPNHIQTLCKKCEALLELHLEEKALNIIENVLRICPDSDEVSRVGNLIYAEYARINRLKKNSTHNTEIIKNNDKKVDNWYDEDNYINKYGLYK